MKAKKMEKRELPVNLTAFSFKDTFSEFKKFEYHPDQSKFSAEVESGEEVLKFVNIIVRIFKNKNIRVTIKYNLLGGHNFLLVDRKIFRTITFLNISSLVGKNISEWIKARGEIYHPENPFILSFLSLKVWINDLRSSAPGSVAPSTLSFSPANDFIYKLVPIRNIYEGIYFHKKGRLLDKNVTEHFPKSVIDKGIKNISDLGTLTIDEQIELFSGTGRKNSIAEHIIKFIDYNNLYAAGRDIFKEAIIVTYDQCLKLVIPTRLSNLNYVVRPIKERKISALKDSILIFFDTEWTWESTEGTDKVLEKETPDFLSYCVVDGFKYCYKGEWDYLSNSGYFPGETSIEGFFNLVKNLQKANPKKEIYCIAHNAAKIENHFIIGYIARQVAKDYDNYEIEFGHIDGTNVHSFKWRDIFFIDSIKFFPGDLKSLCQSMNKQYFKKEISKEKLLSTDWKSPDEESRDYAILDSVCLAEMWMEGTKMLDLIVGSRDLGRINYASFKSGSAVIKWFFTRDDVASIEDLRAYEEDPQHKVSGELGWDSEDMAGLRDIIFFGGRTECFWIGTSEEFKRDKVLMKHKKSFFGGDKEVIGGRAYAIKIDRVSSYPAEMAGEPMPGKLLKIHTPSSLEDLDKILLRSDLKIFLIYGEIKYKREMALPLVPYKTDKLLFPNFMSGGIAVPIWGFEYLALRDNIESITNMEVLEFSKYYGLCRKVKMLYELRKEAKKEGDAAKSTVVKIFMNSGYGSMALNPVREVAYLAKGNKFTQLTKKFAESTVMDGPAGFKWVIVKEKKPVNSLIFIGSYITARSRFALWNIGMELISQEGAVLLNCDTDSYIFADFEDKIKYYEKRFTDTGLGTWKLEGFSDVWEIATLKVYRFGDSVTYKGINGTPEELVKEGKIVREVPMEIWGRGREGKLTVTKTIKRMRFKYEKGILPESGRGSVKPFSF